MSLLLTGAGPAGGAFDPLTLSPFAWYKADAIAGKVDGDAISAWLDSSGNAHTASQATGANQPIYKTGIKNGLPVVRFAAASNQWLSTAALTAYNQPVTIIAVTNPTFTGGAQTVVDGTTNNFRLKVTSATGYQLIANGASSNSLTTTAGWHVLSAIFNGASSSFRADGGTPTTDATVSSNSTIIALGAPGVAVETLNGDLAEVLVFMSALSASDRQSVEAYLKTKWGTP